MSESESNQEDGLRAASQRKLSLMQTVKAVAWSFVGMRRGSGYQDDVSKLNPVHVIIAGVVMGLLFIGSLILLVNWIVSRAASS